MLLDSSKPAQAQSCCSKKLLHRGSMDLDRLAFSKEEVARRLGVSRDSVIRAIAKGNIKIIRFGRRVLIPASELARLVAEAK